jgi:hypothetical protein
VQCAELAHAARRPELKATLLDLAKAFLKAAIELERSHALLERDDPSPMPSSMSWEEAQRLRALLRATRPADYDPSALQRIGRAIAQAIHRAPKDQPWRNEKGLGSRIPAR